MLDMDLAMLYGVETRVLNQAVRRNIKRFPADFMFQLNKEEWAFLKSQIRAWQCFQVFCGAKERCGLTSV